VPSQPCARRVPEYFPVVRNFLGRKVGHWHVSTAQVKSEWSYSSRPLYAFMAGTGTIIIIIIIIIITIIIIIIIVVVIVVIIIIVIHFTRCIFCVRGYGGVIF
jgi:hypothetical protein